MEPNKERIKLWVDALRSGRYQQTKEYLYRLKPSEGGSPAGMCCLGVGCEVARLEGFPLEWVPSLDGEYMQVKNLGERGFMPSQVKQWFGITNSFVPVEDRLLGTAHAALHRLNDVYGYTFEQIADILEKTYLSPETPGDLGASN